MGSNMKKELRHDRHTVSLLTDHMVFGPKYRAKILVGDVYKRQTSTLPLYFGLKTI